MIDPNSTINAMNEANAAEEAAGVRQYSDVPTYRKRWVSVVLLLVFIPAMIAIVLSGPIWQNDNGRAEQWTDKQRYQAAIAGAVLLVVGLTRVLAPA